VVSVIVRPLPDERCPICGSLSTVRLGTKQGLFARRAFTIQQCPHCSFVFVADPFLDFATLYSERYYEGEGADSSVDYLFELEHPDLTIRTYEWRGIAEVVGRLRGSLQAVRWLDFGCGNGGLVRFLRGMGVDAVGFEEGWIADEARKRGIPVIDRKEFESSRARFDIVTAIEVLEHLPDPLPILREIRSAMRPGGLFFATTGNSAPISDVLAWHYLLPEIHCSLFQPRTLSIALEQAGFRVSEGTFMPGWENIYAFKILKKLRLRKMNPLMQAVPWSVVGRTLDRRLQLSHQPTGRVD